MKVFSTSLANHYLLGTTTLSAALKITRTDDQVFAYTSAQGNACIGGVVYQRSGLTISDMVNSADMSVDNLEIRTLDDGEVFNRAEIFGGLWKNAVFEIFRYNRADPEGGQNYLMAGTFGEVTINEDVIVCELRSLFQYLQQPIGEVSSKTCRNRLGDGRCGVDLGPFTVTGTLTHATNNQIFRDSARAEADDYFGEGIFRFTGGNNAGFEQKVKLYDADGTFTLSLPMYSTVEVGDTYEVVAGCRKRHDRTSANPGGASDCLDKFDNVPNFRGEPHRKGLDDLTAEPGASV